MLTTILIIVLVALIFGIILFSATSGRRMLKYYEKYSKIAVYCNLTGLEVASYFISTYKFKTKISFTEKPLGDFYSPKQDVIVLSKQTADTSNIASLTITAHELGHVVQNYNKMPLLKVSKFLTTFIKIGSFLITPVILAGIILLFVPGQNNLAITLFLISLGFFVLAYLSKIINIPIEFNASKIAYNFLKEYHVLTEDELKFAKKLLKIAANTYIANLFSLLTSFFR